MAPNEGIHLKGESVCYYLRMSGKAGADERFASDPVYAACKDNLVALSTRYPDIRRRVATAAKSKMR